MPKYELLIASVDEPGAHHRKEGDIVRLRPYPFNWGRIEIRGCLVVIVEMEGDWNDLRSLYEGRLYEDIDYDPNIIPVGPISKVKAKNRFQMPLNIIKDGWMPWLDLTKVRDRLCYYQPFKNPTQLVWKFDGAYNSYRKHERKVYRTQEGVLDFKLVSIGPFERYNLLIEENEVDCVDELEYVIDTKEQVSLIYDKHKKSFKYPTRKIAIAQ